MNTPNFIDSRSKDNAPGKKRVIIFSAELLFMSETFIREQARSLKDWHPILVGDRLVPGGLPLDGFETRLLCPPEEGRLRRWTYVLCRILGLPHLPSVQRLRKIGASLVHVHFGTTATDIWPTVRALGLPMLVTLHGYDINTYREWWESGKGGWQRKRYPRRLLQLANEPGVHFIAVSNAIRERAIEYGIPSEKITVRYVGIDTEKFRAGPIPITQRAKRILFVGRLVEKKGAEYLIRALSNLTRVTPDTELVIVGDGDQRPELERLAVQLSAPVIFTGALTSEEIRVQMHHSRVLCLPSVVAENGDAEGFGQVLLEAQASGLPVISSAMGGATEGLIHAKTGFRVAEKDIRGLSEQLQTVLSDDQLCATLSANAIEFIREKLSLQMCSSYLEQQYDDISTHS